jgi:acid phosphatase type 7
MPAAFMEFINSSRVYIKGGCMKQLRYFFTILLLIGSLASSSGPGNLLGKPEVVHAASDPMIAAAGDIACDPANPVFNGGNGNSNACRQKYTSHLLVDGDYSAVLPLGDIQYYCGGLQAFENSYDLSWGQFRDITHPVVGNHEYINTSEPDPLTTGCTTNTDAAGYFNYFGSAAGNPGQGYYSYDIGDWHLIALNSNCDDAGGCGPKSQQGLWLLKDLADHPKACTLAYWHIPLFSSGGRDELNSQELWQMLYDHGVDVVLNGHDHIYERFVPQKPDGTDDLVRGMRQFTVGTGGANLTSLVTIAHNSEVRNADTFGILKLTLHPTTYDWEFVPEAGKTFTDSGTGYCYGADRQDATPPIAASNLKASVVSGNEVHLNWTAGTDNLALAGYQVFRNGIHIGAANGTSYLDTTTQPGMTYSYSVVAMDLAELISDPSNTVTVTPIGLFNDDFESGNLSHWAPVTNLTVQQEQVYAGNYAARGISNSLSTVAYKLLSTPQDELYYRIRFKILSQTQPMNLMKFRTKDSGYGKSILGVYVSNTGNLGIRNDTLPLTTPSNVQVAKGVWHELQVRLLIEGSAGRTEVWLDGNRIDALSKTESFGTDLIGRLQLGEKDAGVNFDVVYDDVTVDAQFIPSGTQPTITPTFTPTSISTSTSTATLTPTNTSTSPASIIFSDEFESGNLSQWTNVQGLVVQDQHVANGVYAARGNTSGGGATYARKSLATPQTDLYYRIRFKVISQAGFTFNLLKFRTAANGAILGVSINNQGKLSYRNDVALKSVNSSMIVSPGSWHTLQVRVRIADTAGQIEVWYDDALVTALSGTEAFGTNPIGMLQLGENTPGLTYDVAFDDVTVSLPTTIPPTLTYTPTATASVTPSATATQTASATPSQTSTPTATSTSTATATQAATSTVTSTSSAGGNFTFVPVADAYVYSVNPATNFGALTVLRADASPDMRSYLRFNLQGLTGTVKRATLRVFANSASTSGINIHSVNDNTWLESAIHYNNAPSFGNVIASFSPMSGGTWINLDVTAYITGNGTFNFALTTPGSTAISVASRQAGANAPQLIVEINP